MNAYTRPLALALSLALVAGCGGDGPTGATDPTPEFVTLTLDFTYVEVIEDCDGIEGDGDFDFDVVAFPSGNGPSDHVYKERVSLGPGGKSKVIGRRTYRMDTTGETSVLVRFTASELDRSLFGLVYADGRLHDASATASHTYDSGSDTWSHLGPQSITLGSTDCKVRLTWTASGS